VFSVPPARQILTQTIPRYGRSKSWPGPCERWWATGGWTAGADLDDLQAHQVAGLDVQSLHGLAESGRPQEVRHLRQSSSLRCRRLQSKAVCLLPWCDGKGTSRTSKTIHLTPQMVLSAKRRLGPYWSSRAATKEPGLITEIGLLNSVPPPPPNIH